MASFLVGQAAMGLFLCCLFCSCNEILQGGKVYGLDICVPPKFIVEALTPSVMVLGERFSESN